MYWCASYSHRKWQGCTVFWGQSGSLGHSKKFEHFIVDRQRTPEKQKEIPTLGTEGPKDPKLSKLVRTLIAHVLKKIKLVYKMILIQKSRFLPEPRELLLK